MSAPDTVTVLAVVAGIAERVTRRAQPAATMATRLEDLDGMDSLRLLETVALAEEHFGVVVDTEGLGEIATLGDIVTLIAAGRRG